MGWFNKSKKKDDKEKEEKEAAEMELKEKEEEEERKKIEKIRQAAAEEEIRKKKIAQIRERAKREEEMKPIKPQRPIQKEEILEKLTKVSPKEEEERKEFLARVAGRKEPAIKLKEKEAKKEIVFRPVVREQSLLQKIIVRVVMILLLIALAVVIYLLLHAYVFNEKPFVQYSPLPQSSAVSPATSTSEKAVPTPEIPLSLIKVSETKILSFSSTTQVSSLFKQTFQTIIFSAEAGTAEAPEEGFLRILFQNKKTKEFLQFSEFLKAAGVNINSTLIKEFLGKIELQPTLFIYFSKAGEARFGFVAKINNGENIQELMKDWEATISDDLAPLLFYQKGGKVEFVGSFRQVSVGDVKFRYFDSNKPDFGICYSTSGDYFLFTTSGESMMRLINLVK